MNFIQTLYIHKSKDPFKDGFGWVAPEYHLMGWALSCLQLHKLYPNIELYANSSAAKLLIDILELPYDKVNVTHDALHLIDDNLWALPKIFTYSLQEKPFVHLDGDVFLFDRFSEPLLQSELIAQNIERATQYYFAAQKELMEHFTYFPRCVKYDFDQPVPIMAVNAGILGGKNIPFMQEYARLAFKYISDNESYLSSINVDRFNVFFEQHLFYSLAKEQNIPVNCLFPDTINDNEYKHLGEFHEVPCFKTYLHLLGHLKRDEWTCRQMAAKLRDLYPEYFYKIISVCKRNNISLRTSYYYGEKLDSRENHKEFHEKAQEAYHNGMDNAKSCNNPTDEAENYNLSLLQRICSIYMEKPDDSLDKNELKIDFATFDESLTKNLKQNEHISFHYLYGRDLEAINWYCDLFSDEQALSDKMIAQCDEISIIESEFDWAGVFNKFTRPGIIYYAELELSSGQFFNLVIPEVSANRFSLFDLDEMEKIIMEHLSHPLTIQQLLLEMQCYVEEDVIEHHLDEYNSLVITFLKQLVIKKAVKPF